MGVSMVGDGGGMSSSSSTPLGFEKYVCIRARSVSAKPTEYLWYVLKLSSKASYETIELKKKKKRKRVSQTKEDSVPALALIWETDGIPRQACCAALGSTIYSIGGNRSGVGRLRRHLRIGDVSFPEKGWKFGPRMLNRRLYGQAVALCGKIYVFGGTKANPRKSKPWAEVFNPENGVWRCLPDPPSCFFHLGLVALPLDDNPSNKRILVCSRREKGLYIYHVSGGDCGGSWDILDEKFCPVLCCTDLIVVDDTLYWAGGDRVYAYDLRLKETSSGFIDCQEIEWLLGNVRYLPYVPQLIHLGGEMFGFLWCDSKKGYDGCYLSRFRCTSLLISRDVDPQGKKSLRVSAVSTKAYTTEYHLSFFDAMPLDGKFNGLKKLEEGIH